MSQAEATTRPDVAKVLYSVPEAAYALNLSPREIWRMVSEGELPTRRRGRRVLLPKHAIEEWAAREDAASE